MLVKELRMYGMLERTTYDEKSLLKLDPLFIQIYLFKI